MHCTQCALHKEAVTICVSGRGPMSSKVLVVGQNPGGQEDIEGVAFVGRSGKLLSEMMADAGYADDEYRVTNAVRCLTPKNRAPTTEEIKACHNHLKEEIHLVQPSVIIALGDVALRALCKVSGLSNKRGMAHPLHAEFEYACQVYPTYHPAYVLRSPQSKATVVSDLRTVRCRDTEQEEVAWHRADIRGWYSKSPVAIDIETSYYQDGGDTITQIAYAADLEEVTVSSRVPDSILAAPIIGHNSWSFDIPRLRAAGTHIPSLGDDTMVLAYLDDETQPLGLEALCKKYLGVNSWKEGIHAEPGSSEFALYNARDAEYTRRLHALLVERLGPRVGLVDGIIRPAFGALRACSEKGIYVNQSEVAKAKEAFGAEVSHALSELPPGLNPFSPKQVGEYFGIASTTAETLRGLDNPVARAILSARHANKMLSTYCKPYGEVERVHPEYTLWRTVTGRTSARNPNVQNLPRELKGFFGAPPGFTLVSVDYSAIEFRIAAWVAGATSVLDRYRDDPLFDPHTWMSGILGTSRQIAKSANFGLLYMSSPHGLMEYCKKSGLDIDIAEASRIYNLWHVAMPEFKYWYGRTGMELAEKGYIESKTGRRRHFGDPKYLPNGRGFAEMLREGVNFQVQSLAADVALVALSLCHQMGLPINGFVHDSIMFEFKDTIFRELIRRTMTHEVVEYLYDRFGFRIDIPLAVEFTYTKGAPCHPLSLAAAP